MANLTKIIGIRIQERTKGALEIQNILTKYGCSIKTRIGLHDNDEALSDSSGLMLLELTGLQEEQDNLCKTLSQIDGVTVKEMEL